MSYTGEKYNEINYRKTQSQLQFQSTLKLEEQAYSNEILCRMLSTAECYFYRVINKSPEREIFGYYNGFNSGNTKSLEHLKKQLLNEIEIFKCSYEDYIYHYDKYDFPINLTMENILNVINQWKYYLIRYQKDKEIKYYDSICELIKGNSGICFRKEIKELNKGKVNKYGQVSRQLMKNIPYIQEKAEKFVQRIRENAKNGIYEVKVALYGKYEDDYDLIEGQKHYNVQNTDNINNRVPMNVDYQYQKFYNNDREKDKKECIKLFNNLSTFFDYYCSKIYNYQYLNRNEESQYLSITEIVDNLNKNIYNFDYLYEKFREQYKGISKDINELISKLKIKVDEMYKKTKNNEIILKLIKLIDKYNE